jgi:prepilin-type N-terminal cleavage/methylation domain-containing protein
MKNPLPGRAPRGFSLIELLVVMAVMLVLLTLGMPALQNSLRQSKMRGISQEISVLMRLARIDAIKTSSQAVVQIVPPTATDPGRVQAFSDRNSDNQWNDGEPALASFTLPTGVTFEDNNGVLDKDSVDGFSADPAGGPNMAIFRSDGSIAEGGGFRFADTYEHYMEVHVELKATRVEVRKYEAGSSKYVSNGGNDNNGKAWTWD